MRSLFLSVAIALMLLSRGVATRAVADEPSRPATLLVYLPADAKLTIDDQPTTSTSAVRRFVTPPLEHGKTFYYTMRTQAVRGDQTVTVRQKVQVRAGEETTVSMWPAGQNEGPVAVESTSYYPPNAGPARLYYTMPAGGYPSAHLLRRTEAPRVSSFSEQSPSYGAGPPGSFAPWASGNLVGR